MLFHDPIFLCVFLPIVLIFYFYIFKKNKKYIYIFLIFSGYVFYASWNIKFSPIIIVSIIVNYYFSFLIIKSRYNKKKIILTISIIFNVFYLGVFKYSDFFINNINFFLNTNLNQINLPFPLALSFVTFQTIGFLIECHNEEIKNINFKKYALFIIFFPQLIAGPIVKYNYMIKQFENKKNFFLNNKNIIVGLIILTIGIIKKTIVADNLSIISDQIFSQGMSEGFIDNWVGSISFTMQIYFDFSGYIDMATGISLLFNIHLPDNFNSPFKSKNIIEFWQRWHITLTNFLTSYLYFPISKKFKNLNFAKSMLTTIIVFLIAGLWHGPSWLFVIFGFLHGIGLIINQINNKIFNFKINKFISIFITFIYVNFTFVFFRSIDLDMSTKIISNMIDLKNFDFYDNIILTNLPVNTLLIFLIAILICFFFKNTNYIKKFLLKKNYI